MKRKSFHDMNCSIAQTLEIIGEWWSLLILREALFGTRRFDDFQAHLGVARNILTERLKKLTDCEVLERVVSPEGGKRYEYRPTQKGEELFPVLVALLQWGDRWVLGSEQAPVRIVERVSGKDVAQLRVLSQDRRPLTTVDVAAIPGPGATQETQTRLAEQQKLRER